VSASGAPRIFISYRRSDDSQLVGRVHDRLALEFGVDNVFQDLSTLTPGSEFRREIARAIGRSTTALVIIGPRWDADRLFDRADLVRFEVEEALRRDLLVVPVLLGPVEMPTAERLPMSIHALRERQAFRLYPDDVIRSVEMLADAVRHHHGRSGSAPFGSGAAGRGRAAAQERPRTLGSQTDAAAAAGSSRSSTWSLVGLVGGGTVLGGILAALNAPPIVLIIAVLLTIGIGYGLSRS
jgi:hypothetical protein